MAHDDSLPWVRLDAKMPMNKKIIRLVRLPGGAAAAFSWTCSLSYSGFQGSGGFIYDEELPFIHCKPAAAKMLVKANLWHRDDERGGYEVHDYSEYNQTRETTRAIKVQQKVGGITGNHKKYHDGQPIKCNCAERIAAVESGKMPPKAHATPVLESSDN